MIGWEDGAWEGGPIDWGVCALCGKNALEHSDTLTCPPNGTRISEGQDCKHENISCCKECGLTLCVVCEEDWFDETRSYPGHISGCECGDKECKCAS